MIAEMCEIDDFWHLELKAETADEAARLARMGVGHLSLRKAGNITAYAGTDTVSAIFWIRKRHNAGGALAPVLD